MSCRISKHFSFADGGLSDYLPGPIKDLDQTGPLTAGKTRKHFALVHIYSYQRININALLKQDLVPVEIYMDLLLLN